MTKIGGLGKLSEGFLGSVDQIEEPILILLLPENSFRCKTIAIILNLYNSKLGMQCHKIDFELNEHKEIYTSKS